MRACLPLAIMLLDVNDSSGKSVFYEKKKVKVVQNASDFATPGLYSP